MIKKFPALDKNMLFTALLAVISIVMLFVPTGFEQIIAHNAIKARAEVLKTDNSLMRQHGIVKTGAQKLELKVLNTKYKGQIIVEYNQLIGKMEMDKIFKPGDTAFVVLNTKDGAIANATVIDHYRLHIEAVLFVLFFIAVTAVAGKTGLKAMMTFVFTVIFLWKILLPAYLRGWDPILVSLGSVTLLAGVIVFSIAGFTRKGASAYFGAMAGVAMTCVLSIIFGKFFKIHGAVQPFSEPLLYTGFPFMKLTSLFYSGIFIASSGVIMDVSMDISAAMHEIKVNSPSIGFRALAHSGREVGKAVLGTTTTTLLLAYFGGYASMFMLFIAMGTPVENILNIQYVSAEIMHTLVGSFGLVTVVPFTAYIGGLIFSREKTAAIIPAEDPAPSVAGFNTD